MRERDMQTCVSFMYHLYLVWRDIIVTAVAVGEGTCATHVML